MAAGPGMIAGSHTLERLADEGAKRSTPCSMSTCCWRSRGRTTGSARRRLVDSPITRGRGARAPSPISASFRLSSNQAFTDQAKLPAEAARVPAEVTHHPRHRFVAEPEAVDTPVFATATAQLLGHRQVTDSNLLTRASRRGVRLATFDRRIETIADDPRPVLRLTP